MKLLKWISGSANRLHTIHVLNPNMYLGFVIAPYVMGKLNSLPTYQFIDKWSTVHILPSNRKVGIVNYFEEASKEIKLFWRTFAFSKNLISYSPRRVLYFLGHKILYAFQVLKWDLKKNT